MHAHIQSVLQAVQSMQDIEHAFWGPRHPVWSSTKHIGNYSMKMDEYRHELVLPLLSDGLGDRNGRLEFRWSVRVDWRHPSQIQHVFRIELAVDSGEAMLADDIRLDHRSVTLRREAKADAVGAFDLWRRRYHEIVSRLGVELPSTFYRPKLPVETYSKNGRAHARLKNLAADLGTLVFDEMCLIPVPQGV